MESNEVVPKASPGAVKPEDVELSPEAVAKIGSVLGEVLTPLAALRETTDKAHSAYIAYMDRIILLAGGTLTLTFTAIATISSHIDDLGRSAVHPYYVVAECWLLVATIVMGLAYSRLTISLRQKNDQQIVMAQVSLTAKLKLMEANPKSLLKYDLGFPQFKTFL